MEIEETKGKYPEKRFGVTRFDISPTTRVFSRVIKGENVVMWAGVSYFKYTGEKVCSIDIGVGLTDREIERWECGYSMFLPDEIRGSIGLSGLCAIWKALPGTIQWLKSIGVDEISICSIGADENGKKRERAYRVLTRLGFYWSDQQEEYILNL